jgi:4-amino-4-deoxy-L-arabinose transferase-like glycosyltransferase
MKLSRRLTQPIILGLTLLAFLLRAYRLDFQSLWIEEAWTLFFARLSPAELWHLLQTTEIKPPLYFPSMIYWVKLTGESEYALRFYSLVFGVLAVPFTYRLGRALGGVRLGLLAALLLAVAPYQIWHSQEARMYSVLTAASVMSMWGFVNLWRRGGWRWWLVYLIGTEWAIMVHYHGAVLIGIQGLFLLLTWRRHWRGYLKWAATLLLLLLMYLPWLMVGGNLLQGYLNWIEQPTLAQVFLRSAIAYSLTQDIPPAQAIPLLALFAALYLAGLITAARRRWGQWRGWEMVTLLLCYTIAPLLTAWFYGQLRTPVFLERYMIFIQPGYLLTIAIGLLGVASLTHRRLGRSLPAARPPWRWAHLLAGLLTVALLVISGWTLSHHYTDPLYAKPDWRAVAQTIANFDLPGDAVLLTGDGGEIAFDYYYRNRRPTFSSFNLLPPTDPAYKKARPGVDDPAAVMRHLAAQYRRLWFTPYGVDIDPVVEAWLAQNAWPAWHSWIGQKRLALYQLQADLTAPLPQHISFPDPATGLGPELVDIALPQTAIPAGELLPLTLTWQTAAPLPAAVQLSLRLINPRGDVFGQSDWPPLPASTAWPTHQPIPDRRSLWLPADTPPGDYLLQLVVYHPATGQPLGQPATIPGLRIDPARLTPPPAALSMPNFTPPAAPQPLHLIGSAYPEQIQPGQDMWLWLYWLAETPPAPNTTFRLTLQAQGDGLPVDVPLAEIAGPLDNWQAGQVRRTIVHLPTSPRLSGDTATIRVAAGPDFPPIELGPVALNTRPHQFTPPPVAAPLTATFGQPPQLTLLGFSPANLTPTNPVNLTLFWRADTDIDTAYTVFIQLLNEGGQVVAQVDAPPQGGTAPTITWLPGEILPDAYRLPLPADLPPGGYRLITGLYRPDTGARLPVTSGGDFVELSTLTVQ